MCPVRWFVECAASLAVYAVLAGCAHQTHNTAAVVTSPTPAPISTGDYPAFGHAADFGWVAGRYSRSLLHGDCAFVAFSATPTAPWGGKIAIDAPPDMLAGFADGDMVVAYGELDTLPHGDCGAVALRARRIEEH